MPLDTPLMNLAFELRRNFDLDMPDAVVLASVSTHLTESKLRAAFVTKNWKDFDDPGVREYLADKGCNVFFAFGEALGYALGDV